MNIETLNSFLCFRKANQFESKYDFKLYTQWTENYFCDEVSSEGLWSELISLARRMLMTDGSDNQLTAETLWENFPVQHWKRKRVHPKSEHFHSSVPHPGEVTPPTSTSSDNANIPATDILVKL